MLGARRGGPLGAETLPLDLMRLENVRSFASTVERELGPAQINSLMLNAGLLFPNDDTRSADGFEAAFAVIILLITSFCGFCCPGLRKAPPSF